MRPWRTYEPGKRGTDVLYRVLQQQLLASGDHTPVTSAGGTLRLLRNGTSTTTGSCAGTARR